MLLTSREVAQRLEQADILHISRAAEACGQIFPDQKCFTVPVGGGVAAFTLPSYGRKLNRIMGYGMNGPVPEEDLIAVESLFTKNGIDTAMSLCPLADPSAIELLFSRGYSVSSFINSYVRVLTDADLQEPGEDEKEIKISCLAAESAHEFPALSVAGYEDGGRAMDLLETLGHIAVVRADTQTYLATIDGKPAGTAALALLGAEKGGVAHLFIDSTVPEFRGRGVQLALLRARLREARKAGYDLASVQARPGNGSCRNIERAGFVLAYTKVWCARPCG